MVIIAIYGSMKDIIADLTLWFFVIGEDSAILDMKDIILKGLNKEIKGCFYNYKIDINTNS